MGQSKKCKYCGSEQLDTLESETVAEPAKVRIIVRRAEFSISQLLGMRRRLQIDGVRL
jgi:hypothetical protein